MTNFLILTSENQNSTAAKMVITKQFRHLLVELSPKFCLQPKNNVGNRKSVLASYFFLENQHEWEGLKCMAAGVLYPDFSLQKHHHHSLIYFHPDSAVLHPCFQSWHPVKLKRSGRLVCF